jgi:hypothetical protein
MGANSTVSITCVAYGHIVRIVDSFPGPSVKIGTHGNRGVAKVAWCCGVVSRGWLQHGPNRTDDPPTEHFAQSADSLARLRNPLWVQRTSAPNGS